MLCGWSYPTDRDFSTPRLPPVTGPLAVLSGWPRRVAAVLCLLLAAVSALGRPESPVSQHRSPIVVTAKRWVLAPCWPPPTS